MRDGVSRMPNTRSADANARCRKLSCSENITSGKNRRRVYSMKSTSVPTVIVTPKTPRAPIQMISMTAAISVDANAPQNAYCRK